MRSKVVAVALLLPLLAASLGAQRPDAASIAPPENLVADGLPPVPASLAENVRRYTESRTASLAAWHPTAREMLISTRFGNTPQIHRVKSPLGARYQLTFFNEPVSGASYEPVAGRYFLFTRDEGGNEFAQIYRFDLSTASSTLLTDGGRSQNGGIRWSNKGDRIAYGSTRRNGASRDIYVMNPLDPKTDRRILEVQGGGWAAGDWSPDDRTLIVSEGISVSLTRLHLLDVASGKLTLLTDDGTDTVSYDFPRFSRDGKGIYAVTDRNSEFAGLAYMDLTTKRWTPLTSSIKWDIEDLDLSDDGRYVAIVANVEGISRLYLLETATRKLRPISGIPSGVIGGLEFHDNSRDLGFSVSSARSPSDVYSLNVATGVVTRWTESELGGLIASELSEPSLIRWKSFDGREITGFYYKPPARFSGKRPVIINIHGGPEGQSRPGFQGRSNYHLNELGVAIIYPNVRGSTGFGKNFVKLDNGMKREDSVKDIGALLDWIAQQPDLDASKVMVTGGSYGGYMTLAVATTYSDRICCSLDVVGISNFNTFLQNTESYRRDLRRVEYGDERQPEMRAFFERMAPLNNASKITKPLFVVQGANDPRVPRTEAEQMVARVKQNGTPVWYLLGRDEGHGFRKKANVDYQFYSTVGFIRRYLLNEQPSSNVVP